MNIFTVVDMHIPIRMYMYRVRFWEVHYIWEVPKLFQRTVSSEGFAGHAFEVTKRLWEWKWSRTNLSHLIYEKQTLEALSASIGVLDGLFVYQWQRRWKSTLARMPYLVRPSDFHVSDGPAALSSAGCTLDLTRAELKSLCGGMLCRIWYLKCTTDRLNVSTCTNTAHLHSFVALTKLQSDRYCFGKWLCGRAISVTPPLRFVLWSTVKCRVVISSLSEMQMGQGYLKMLPFGSLELKWTKKDWTKQVSRCLVV